MVMLGGFFLLVLFLFFPEPGRGIVDNRSLLAQGVNRAPLFFLHGSSKVEEGNPLGQRNRLNAPT